MNTAKWMLVGLLSGFLASTAVSCGPAVKACGPKECPFGCCDSAGTCQGGSSDAQCGAQGAACSTCGLAQRCNLGVCTNIGSGAGPGGGSGGGFTGGGSGGGGGVTGGGSGGGFTGGGTGGGATGGGTGGGATGGGGGACDGCFFQGSCVPRVNSNTAIACGQGGITCVSCSGTQTCQNYVCTSGTGGGAGGGAGGGTGGGATGGGTGGGTASCSPSNCGGCCSGNTCVPLSANNDTVCGFGGAGCANCAASAGTCNLSTFTCDFSPPDAGSCSGCLNTSGTCIPYSTSYQSNITCGGGGDFCQACSGNVCEGGNCGLAAATPVGNTRVRLVGGNGVNSGRLEVFANGGWGQVCDDVFDTNLNGPNVVCRDLGFAGAVSQANDPGNGDFFLLDQVTCTGTEAQLLQCAHDPFGVEDCASSEAVFITCGP